MRKILNKKDFEHLRNVIIKLCVVDTKSPKTLKYMMSINDKMLYNKWILFSETQFSAVCLIPTQEYVMKFICWCIRHSNDNKLTPEEKLLNAIFGDKDYGKQKKIR